MSATEEVLVGNDAVIVPPKTEPVQVKFRWPPDLAEEIRRIAERTGRSINETGEMLMRWAVARAQAELDADESRIKEQGSGGKKQ